MGKWYLGKVEKKASTLDNLDILPSLERDHLY